MSPLLAITFDWYGTLAEHRNGIGRGSQFASYLASKGLSADPWDRGILFDLFDFYADSYRPRSLDQEKRAFWVEFTRQLFAKANVRCPSNEAAVHADMIRDIFGPGAFKLFSEVKQVLPILKKRKLRLGVISNWQRGLNHFCEELEITPYLDVIVSSADVGFEKPDIRIFSIVLKRLGAMPEHTVHVGDSIDDDVHGAIQAGLRAIHLDRNNAESRPSENQVQNLYQLEQFLA